MDGFDFPDNLDLSEHSITGLQIDTDVFDEVLMDHSDHFADNINNNNGFHDDSIIANFTVPTARPTTTVSSSSFHLSPQHHVTDSDTANTEMDMLGINLMGTNHSGPPALTRNSSMTTMSTTDDDWLQGPSKPPAPRKNRPRRRKTADSAPEYMKDFWASRAKGDGPAWAHKSFDDIPGGLGGEEPGFDDHPNVVGRIKRRKSDSELLDIDNDHQEDQLITGLGNESFAAADISAAVHEAQEKITRLRALLGHDQDELIQDLVGNSNNHQPRNNQMMFPPQDHHRVDRPMRRSSEHGMPWSPTFHHEAVHHQQQHQQQQACMQQVTMVKLQAAMERTNSTMKLLQDWDRAHGLPASHCQTMVNSSRSRKQLKEGVVLKKWNGSPLLNFMRRT